jgi:hypothetical protein
MPGSISSEYAHHNMMHDLSSLPPLLTVTVFVFLLSNLRRLYERRTVSLSPVQCLCFGFVVGRLLDSFVREKAASLVFPRR